MPRWMTPYRMEGALARGGDLRGLTWSERAARRCRFCRGVFRTVAARQSCEDMHRDLFRQQRRDLRQAIDRARAESPTDDRRVARMERLLDRLPDL